MSKVLTLENNEKYAVVQECYIDNEKYVYLVNLKNYLDIMIVQIHEKEVTQVKDPKLLKQIINHLDRMIKITED